MTIGYLARIVLAHTSGLPKDDDTLDFAFRFAGAEPSESDFGALAGAVGGFLTANYGAEPTRPDYYLADQVSRAANAHDIKIYEIPGAEGAKPAGAGANLGSPKFATTFTVGAPQSAGNDFPAEVAVCLSFHADLTGVPEEDGATRPAAQRRGRIYFGPLKAYSGVENAGDLEVRVAGSLRTILTSSAKETLSDLAVTGGWSWSVWSRTGWILRPVVGAYVDDAFDTIRKRGVGAVARTSVSIP